MIPDDTCTTEESSCCESAPATDTCSDTADSCASEAVQEKDDGCCDHDSSCS